MRKSVYIYTYGCQMNVHDSEKMLGSLAEEGYRQADSPDQADLIIFNTCAIRDKAEQKFFSQLGRTKFIKRKKPALRIAVAGCVAQNSQEKIFRRAPYVDYVLGPQNIHQVRDLMDGNANLYIADNPDMANQIYPATRNSLTRAWVSIMYGCNNFCSYCIVPYARGREISRPGSAIVEEIRGLRERGYKEITLLGQNVNSFRSDMDFVGLLQAVDRTGIDRVRFVTSHPRDLSDELIAAMSELPSVCEHLHLPLQSGSDSILGAMNRRYTYAQYLDKAMKVRDKVPGITITTDIIIGFPGETDRDYEDTIRAVTDIGFDGIFGFKYSRRAGTKAYDMKGQVPDEIKNERLGRMLKIQDDITLRKNRTFEGTVQEILIEGPSETDPSMLMGRARNNKIVTFEDNGESEGTLLKIRIEKARHHSLSGKKV